MEPRAYSLDEERKLPAHLAVHDIGESEADRGHGQHCEIMAEWRNLTEQRIADDLDEIEQEVVVDDEAATATLTRPSSEPMSVGRALSSVTWSRCSTRTTSRVKATSAKQVHCVTDPDATMATNARNRHLEPCYKQHTAVDDKMGVTLDVEVTTGEKNEGEMIAPQVDEVKATTGVDIKTVTADAGYAYAKVYGALERRGIDALIPAKAEPIRSRVPLRRFRYDAKHDILRCPRKRVLRQTRPVNTAVFSTLKPRTARAVRYGAIAYRRGE